MLTCPVCGKRKIWRYGSRAGKRGQMRRLLCKNCGHVWEIPEETTRQEPTDIPKGGLVPAELKDYFVELMEQTVSDIEKGMELEKVGWCTFNPEIKKRLAQTGFCETINENIRLVLSKPLPRELAWTDVGDIITDAQKAIELTLSLSKISGTHDLCRGAEYAGLVRMLQTSNFPVLALKLFKEGLNPNDWFIKAPESAYELVSDLAEKLWGLGKTEKALRALAQSNFPVPEKQNTEISEKVKKILTWDLVPKVFRPEILEALGFAWYADLLAVAKKIKYPEGTQIIQEKVATINEVLTGRNAQDIADELLNETREMEARATEECEGQKNQIADWHDIIRLPW